MAKGVPGRLIGIGVPLLIALALASCVPGRNQFAPACPVSGKMKPFDQIVRSRGGSPDFRDLVVRAEVYDVNGHCEPGDTPGTVVAYAHLVVDATRGPALEGDSIGLPVFIAVTGSGEIYDKVSFLMPVEFPRNIDAVRAESKFIRMVIPVTPRKTAAAFAVIGGFDLTPEEVAAWRKAHPH